MNIEQLIDLFLRSRVTDQMQRAYITSTKPFAMVGHGDMKTVPNMIKILKTAGFQVAEANLKGNGVLSSVCLEPIAALHSAGNININYNKFSNQVKVFVIE